MTRSSLMSISWLSGMVTVPCAEFHLTVTAPFSTVRCRGLASMVRYRLSSRRSAAVRAISEGEGEDADVLTGLGGWLVGYEVLPWAMSDTGNFGSVSFGSVEGEIMTPPLPIRSGAY